MGLRFTKSLYTSQPIPIPEAKSEEQTPLQRLMSAVFGFALITARFDAIDQTTDFDYMDNSTFPKPSGADLLALHNQKNLNPKQRAIMRYIDGQLLSDADGQERFLDQVAELFQLGVLAKLKGLDANPEWRAKIKQWEQPETGASFEKVQNGIEELKHLQDKIQADINDLEADEEKEDDDAKFVQKDMQSFAAETKDSRNRRALQTYLREELHFKRAVVPADWTTHELTSMSVEQWKDVLKVDDVEESTDKHLIAQKAYDYVQKNFSEVD